MKGVMTILCVQLILVAGLVVCTREWSDFGVIKQFAFFAGGLALLGVVGWRATAAGRHEMRLWRTDVGVAAYVVWSIGTLLWSQYP